MTEYESTTQGAVEMVGETETFDLLIRHIEVAKRAFSGSPESTHSQEGDELSLLTPDTVCTLLYGASGTFCPLLYIHSS